MPVIGFAAVLQADLIGGLTRHFGEERLLSAGLVLIGAGLLLLALARGLGLFVPSVSALALGIGLGQPSLSSLISRRAGREEQGEVLGVSEAAGRLSRVLGPAAAGMFFAVFGRNAAFYWGAALVGVDFPGVIKLIRSLGTAALPSSEPLASHREGDPAR